MKDSFYNPVLSAFLRDKVEYLAEIGELGCKFERAGLEGRHPDITVWRQEIDRPYRELMNTLCVDERKAELLRHEISMCWMRIREIQTKDLKFRDTPHTSMFPKF